MSKVEESVGFYHKMAELQDKLRKSEEERLRLEEKFTIMMRSCREEEEARLQAVRDTYEKFLEDDKRRHDRNDKILQTLDKIESRANILSAKTERLKLLRQHYEAYLMRMYPLWKNKLGHSIDKRVMNHILTPQKCDIRTSQSDTRILPGNLRNILEHTDAVFIPTSTRGQPPTFYEPYTISPKQDFGVNLELHSPSTPVKRFPSIIQDMKPMKQDILVNKPNFDISSKDPDNKIVNGSLKRSESYFNNDITKINQTENIGNVPHKTESSVTNYIERIADLHIVQTDNIKDVHAERKEDEQDPIVNDHNDSHKHGISADIEIEQNTSKDLLNISLSDDGLVQEGGNISLSNAYVETLPAIQRENEPYINNANYSPLPRHTPDKINMNFETNENKNAYLVQDIEYEGENDKDIEHMKEVDNCSKVGIMHNDSRLHFNPSSEDLDLSPQHKRNVPQSEHPQQKSVHFADNDYSVETSLNGGIDIVHIEQSFRDGDDRNIGKVGQGDTTEVYLNDHQQIKEEYNIMEHNMEINRNTVDTVVEQQPIVLDENQLQPEFEEHLVEQEQHLEENVLPESYLNNTLPQEIEVFDSNPITHDTEYNTYLQHNNEYVEQQPIDENWEQHNEEYAAHLQKSPDYVDNSQPNIGEYDDNILQQQTNYEDTVQQQINDDWPQQDGEYSDNIKYENWQQEENYNTEQQEEYNQNWQQPGEFDETAQNQQGLYDANYQEYQGEYAEQFQEQNVNMEQAQYEGQLQGEEYIENWQQEGGQQDGILQQQTEPSVDWEKQNEFNIGGDVQQSTGNDFQQEPGEVIEDFNNEFQTIQQEQSHDNAQDMQEGTTECYPNELDSNSVQYDGIVDSLQQKEDHCEIIEDVSGNHYNTVQEEHEIIADCSSSEQQCGIDISKQELSVEQNVCSNIQLTDTIGEENPVSKELPDAHQIIAGAISVVEGEAEDILEPSIDQQLSEATVLDPSENLGDPEVNPHLRGALPEGTVEQYRSLLGLASEPASDPAGYSDADDVEDQLAALVDQTSNAPVEHTDAVQPSVNQMAESVNISSKSHSKEVSKQLPSRNSEGHLENPSSQNVPEGVELKLDNTMLGTVTLQEERAAVNDSGKVEKGKESKASDVSSESTDHPALTTQQSSATKQKTSKLDQLTSVSNTGVTLSTVDSVKPQPRAASKKLPGLTKVLESDTESLHLDTPGTSNIDSDEFDFSSEHQ